MKIKIMWLVLSCLMAMALVLASCGPATVEEEEEEVVPEEEEVIVPEEEEEEVLPEVEKGPQYGGQLTLALQAGVSVWGMAQQGAPQEALSPVYERLGGADWSRGPAGTNEYSYLYRYTPGEYRIGLLAESWEQPEPYTFVFHLREGIHWQNKPPVNGRELTADDVVFTMQKWLEFNRSETKVYRDDVTSVEALDKYTVQFKVREGSYANFGSFGWAWIYIAPVETPQVYELDFNDWRSICGTGPFVIKDFVLDSSLLYERNPGYWGYDEVNPENRLPYVDRIKAIVIPDRTTILSALRTGKIDKMSNVFPEEAHSLMKTNPELKYVSCIDAQAYPGVSWRMNEGPFADIRVRKAMSMAIDRKAIIRDYLAGEGAEVSWPQCAGWGESVATPVEKMPPEIREIYEYNPEKARQLLAEAGYADGFQTHLISFDALMERLQILQAYWKDIGVDVELRPMESGALWGTLFSRRHQAMFAAGWGQGDPVGVLAYFTTGHYYNLSDTSDAYYDESFYTIMETADDAERDRLCKELDLYYKSQVFAVAFPSQVDYTFWQPWLKSYHGEQSLGTYYGQGQVWARIWIDQDLKMEMIGE